MQGGKRQVKYDHNRGKTLRHRKGCITTSTLRQQQQRRKGGRVMVFNNNGDNDNDKVPTFPTILSISRPFWAIFFSKLPCQTTKLKKKNPFAPCLPKEWLPRWLSTAFLCSWLSQLFVFSLSFPVYMLGQKWSFWLIGTVCPNRFPRHNGNPVMTMIGLHLLWEPRNFILFLSELHWKSKDFFLPCFCVAISGQLRHAFLQAAKHKGKTAFYGTSPPECFQRNRVLALQFGRKLNRVLAHQANQDFHNQKRNFPFLSYMCSSLRKEGKEKESSYFLNKKLIKVSIFCQQGVVDSMRNNEPTVPASRPQKTIRALNLHFFSAAIYKWVQPKAHLTFPE